MEDFISIEHLSRDEVAWLLELSEQLKARHAAGRLERKLTGRVVALFFEKASLRTRLSFEAAAMQLGAGTIFNGPDAGRLGERESIPDFSRTAARYCDCLILRTFSHDAIIEVAKHSSAPVINALSDLAHPCQALSDMLTIKEELGRLEGVRLAFIGDSNNVARSLAQTCALCGVQMTIASPPGHAFEAGFARSLGPGVLKETGDPREAVRGADVIYTDVWVSMGQEKEKAGRLAAFRSFQVNEELLGEAPESAVVMHCLPAHRGEEITDGVIESPRSVVFEQAENRLHFARALLWELI